jgi:hypothetical protein
MSQSPVEPVPVAPCDPLEPVLPVEEPELPDPEFPDPEVPVEPVGAHRQRLASGPSARQSCPLHELAVWQRRG